MTRRPHPSLALGAASLLAGLAVAVAPSPASAQYIYLDANADGVRTADVFSTTVGLDMPGPVGEPLLPEQS